MDAQQQEKITKSWNLGMDTLYLAACALQGKTAQWDPDRDLTQLYQFCRFHSVTAIVAIALETVWKDTPPSNPQQTQCWEQAKNKAIRKNILLSTERQAITAHLEQIGCWYMPLKGSLLQFDYPMFGMRQMTDNDILIDPQFRVQIHDLMVSRGYAVNHYLQNDVDTYQKPPVYNFEMHTALFGKAEGENLEQYYRDIREKALADDGSSWGHHLSADDFYIYMITHAYKHLIHSGIGIRNLLDVSVYLNKHGEELNRAYVDRELKKLGAYDFECQCRVLSEKLLGETMDESRLTEQERELLGFFFTSGTFGTAEQRLVNELQKFQGDSGRITAGARLKYIFRQVFPTREALRFHYPDIDAHPWKIPFIPFLRLFRAIFVHPAKSFKEMKKVWNTHKS